MPVYQVLPLALTQPLAMPEPPEARCTHADGTPAICVGDALAMIPSLQAVLDIANADRARAALLGRTSLEPTP